MIGGVLGTNEGRAFLRICRARATEEEFPYRAVKSPESEN
jgi:hypothetical protein